MDEVTISVDVLERRSDVPALLIAEGAEVELVTLAIGDYVVGDRVIERKTVADLHKSSEHERCSKP